MRSAPPMPPAGGGERKAPAAVEDGRIHHPASSSGSPGTLRERSRRQGEEAEEGVGLGFGEGGAEGKSKSKDKMFRVGSLASWSLLDMGPLDKSPAAHISRAF